MNSIKKINLLFGVVLPFSILLLSENRWSDLKWDVTEVILFPLDLNKNITKVFKFYFLIYKNMDIKKYMKKPVLINQDATLRGAVEMMINEHSNSLIVVDDDDKLIGGIDVVSLIKAIVPEYIDSEKQAAHFTTDNLFKSCISDAKDYKISDFMLKFTKVINPHTSMMEAAMMVTEGRQSKIPVLDEKLQPIGIITRGSLKKVLGAELGFISD